MFCFLRFLIFFIPLCLYATSEQDLVRRIHAHLLITDYVSACTEAKQAVHDYPKSKPLWEAHIEALGKSGDEKGMINAWERYVALFPEERQNRQLAETIAWSTIKKGARSPSPKIRAISILSAYLGQDAQSIPILVTGLQDSNAFVRAISVQFSSHFRDVPLQEEMLKLLHKEIAWDVRLEAIRAVGMMKIVEAEPILIAIIDDSKSAAEEKAAAMESLVYLFEAVEREELEKFATSNRAGLRQLASLVVGYFEMEEHLDLISPLAKDHHPEVRVAALQTLGSLRATLPTEDLLHDPDDAVAITAAWVLTRFDPQKGQEAFVPWLEHQNRDIRILAASALAATGKYGLPLMEHVFKETKDPYVRMNLALGLIHQDTKTDEACDILYQGFQKESGRWGWRDHGIFHCLSPSDVKHKETIPNYPEVVDQLTRLEILNILAILEHAKAQEATKQFLSEKTWGISGFASALLLTEGDAAAVEVVKSLLTDTQFKVRVQAALILALWGQGDEVLPVLTEAYRQADRELKEKILEGIGQIKSTATIPFLMEQLREPFPTLRLIAASSIIKVLYR